ncbi:MAG: SH3 domain-containing protein, partial [Caldilineaceae bacterium]|nr:SH3 domain-containing protein [Caldilineaceae bacterium]
VAAAVAATQTAQVPAAATTATLPTETSTAVAQETATPTPVATNTAVPATLTPTSAPPTATTVTSACQAVRYATRLRAGMRAYVALVPPVANRVRENPARSARVTGSLDPGVAMTILDGPRCADSWFWWYVQADNNVRGWTSEGQAGEYWLVPGEPPVVTPTTTPTTAPPGTSDFSGEWQTNFAYLSLNQQGNQVVGSYTRYSRTQPTTLSGSVNNGVLTGVNETGTSFRLVLSADGQNFTGTWTGRDGRQYPWCGTRGNALPPGCGFSGYWQTNHRTGGWVELTQSGDWITGRYFNGSAEGNITGQFEFFGRMQEYSLAGSYEADSNSAGDRGFIRFTLVDLGNEQFTGCWRNTVTGTVGNWCGWHGAVGSCPQVSVCE